MSDKKGSYRSRLIGFIARHGETELNNSNCFRSWIDVALNPTGIQQAHEAAKFLKDKQIVNCISSPLLRAFVTADILAASHRLTVFQHRGLFPWRLGVFSGLPRKDNDAALKLFIDNPKVNMPGGESLEDFEERQWAFWQTALRQARERGLTLFVAHTSNVVALENMTSDTPSATPEQSESVKPGGVAAIYWDGKKHRIEPVFGKSEPAKFGGS